MDTTIIYITLGLGGLIIGFLIAKMLEKSKGSQLVSEAKKTASGIVKEAKSEAESIKKDKILQAKEKFIELKAEHEKVILNREKKMSEAEKRTRDKESQVSSELSKNKKLNASLESKKKEYEDRLNFLDKRQAEVDKVHRRQVEQLEGISSLSAEDAKEARGRHLRGGDIMA